MKEKHNQLNKAYIYPISSRYKGKSYNPYIDNFIDSLQRNFYFVNKDYPSNKGIIDLLSYINKIQFIFLHWPENIAERRMGILQTFFLFCLIPIFKIKRIKIVYFVHNKISHTANKIDIKKSISRLLINNSFLIVTHARSGIDFINSMTNKQRKIFFFPHPVDLPLVTESVKKSIDVLLWGNIAPYKGIHEFLKVVITNKDTINGKILIAGKVSSNEYLNSLIKVKSENVEIIDKFLNEKDLANLINQSKIILFPYHKESILSSGAFAKSLAYPGVEIIGPNCGAFMDFKHFENVNTFENMHELIGLINQRLSNYLLKEKLPIIENDFVKAYSWESFGNELTKELINS